MSGVSIAEFNGNMQAFPGDFDASGLTKREWYAGQALAGLMAFEDSIPFLSHPDVQEVFDNNAEICTRMADAVLERLAKGANK